jgi:hypothetical protein
MTSSTTTTTTPPTTAVRVGAARLLLTGADVGAGWTDDVTDDDPDSSAARGTDNSFCNDRDPNVEVPDLEEYSVELSDPTADTQAFQSVWVFADAATARSFAGAFVAVLDECDGQTIDGTSYSHTPGPAPATRNPSVAGIVGLDVDGIRFDLEYAIVRLDRTVTVVLVAGFVDEPQRALVERLAIAVDGKA